MLPHVLMTLANTCEKPNGWSLRASSVHGRMGFRQARYLLGSPSKLVKSQSLVWISTNNLAYLLASLGRSPIPELKGFFIHYNGGHGLWLWLATKICHNFQVFSFTLVLCESLWLWVMVGSVSIDHKFVIGSDNGLKRKSK